MPTTRRVFIGLPAYNEEIALPRLLDRVERLTTSAALPITVVLYNDGSTDSTVPIARSRQQQMPLVILDCPINKGLGAGLRALVEYTVANADEDGRHCAGSPRSAQRPCSSSFTRCAACGTTPAAIAPIAPAC